MAELLLRVSAISVGISRYHSISVDVALSVQESSEPPRRLADEKTFPESVGTASRAVKGQRARAARHPWWLGPEATTTRGAPTVSKARPAVR